MAKTTGIAWCHHTFNPWRGCTKVSPGCANCYAEQLSGRNPSVLGVWGPRGTRPIAAESYWREPLTWSLAAQLGNFRGRVFCGSLMDWAEGPDTMPPEAVAPIREARRRLGGLIDLTPSLDWLLLTKRPDRIAEAWRELFADDAGRANVWLLTSVEDQPRANERIPQLLRHRDRSPVLGLSCEPLLGPVDLGLDQEILTDLMDSDDQRSARHRGTYPFPYLDHKHRSRRQDFIQWVIAGGESGPNARPMHPSWPRLLRQQCHDAAVPFFFKQWGEGVHPSTHRPHGRVSRSGHWSRDPMDVAVWRLSKRLDPHTLDGTLVQQFPSPAPGSLKGVSR